MPVNPTTAIRRSHQFGWSLTACLLAFATPAAAQTDSRYALPAAAAVETATAQPDAAILSYHRPDATTPKSEETDRTRIPQSPIAAAANANPLRNTSNPPQTEPTATPAAQPPSAEVPLKTAATVASNPATNPASPPGASLTEPPATPPFAAAPTFPPISPPTYRQDPAVTPASTDAPTLNAAAAAPPAEEKPAAAFPIPAASTSPPPTIYSTSSEAAPTRRLAPRSSAAAKKDAASNGPKKLSFPFQINSLQSFSTAGAGLAIIVGLFLICAWMLRRGGPKSNGMLPPEAFAVLGRSPLTAQSIAHLLRIGNKLVLVAVSPDGAQPLTEVTDPIEVDRLTGLCSSSRGHGPAAEFQQVLAQLAKEPARGFLGAEATSGRRR